MLMFLTIALVAVSLACALLIRKVHRQGIWLESLSLSLRECQAAMPTDTESPAHEYQARESTQVITAHQKPNLAWINHAYPLQQLTIKLQGTRHSNPASIIAYLSKVTARLNAGDSTGQEHDDDFGYHFEFVKASPGPSFFDTPSSKY
ncbi:hypothetical protein [Pseudomonas baetica]|uniref:hypothetical protein n=1 Tax=Pseudomonas baetica TaxID=674054 RepID=UPI00240513F8|nr:hypothetical protein [Pseudomonas baetica]MDF9778944.1 hypothetical protein [Pseudomonas baetica]